MSDDAADPEELTVLIRELTGLARAIYARGFESGGLSMRDNILQAANRPMAMVPGRVSMMPEKVSVEDKVHTHLSKAARRAPSGLVARAIRDVLQAEPGISITEIAQKVMTRHPEVQLKSVGNQLRRGEGDLYHRTDKYSWYLGPAPKTETAEARPLGLLGRTLDQLEGGDGE